MAHIDATAAAQGLSQQEYLRRLFETERSEAEPRSNLTIEDMRRAASAGADLDNPEVLKRAGDDAYAATSTPKTHEKPSRAESDLEVSASLHTDQI